jgi:GNAT superfamily N-acetyltransferase
MIIRLRNLAMRTPTLGDVVAVTQLLKTCALADRGVEEITEQTLLASWVSTDFHLDQDSWVVTTLSDQLVGYGAIRRGEGQQFIFEMHVHPGYRQRGIGTFLLWMIEERARQLATSDACRQDDGRVVLRTTIINTCDVARHLYEREGYDIVRHLWQLAVRADDCKHVMEVVSLTGTLASMQHQRTGMYSTQQYIIYEKCLSFGHVPLLQEELCQLA